MCDATNNKLFGLGLIAMNKVRKHIYCIIDNVIDFLYQCLSDMRIESLTG